MPAQTDGAPMSNFELRRQQNAEANAKLLNAVSAVAKKVAPPKPPPKRATPSRTRTRSTPVKTEPPRATRRSARVAGLGADNDTLKRKYEVEAEVAAEQAKAKKLRVNGDLSLGDVEVEGKKWASGVGGLKGIGAQPGVPTFTEDDIRETTDKGLKELRLRMSDLKLYEHWAPNGKSHCTKFVRVCH